MLEETALRFAESKVSEVTFLDSLIVGSVSHSHLLEHIFPDGRKVLEPIGRNSAPAVAAACLAHREQDLILILPADHSIQDVKAFHQAIEIAANAAEDGSIVTFGIEPTHAATGYGYIKAHADAAAEALDVEAFVEKPDLETAESYLAAGTYYWNAGIFLFRVDSMIKALESFAPEILDNVRRAMRMDSADDFIRLDAQAFARTPSISIDYAVMEKAGNVKTVPVDMGWSDVGGYRALHMLLAKSPQENVSSGPVILENSEGLYVRSEGPIVAGSGLKNLAIVATKNEVMITPLENDAAAKTLGIAARANPHQLKVPESLIKDAQDWLWTIFSVWSANGWDQINGGFVEQLNFDGSPDALATRRVRVQARQVFSFAKAIKLGWPDTEKAKTLIEAGLGYIDTRLRAPGGGFVHTMHANGRPIDQRRDLYDHAFIVLAGAAAFEAINSDLGLKLADDALSFINDTLKDEVNGGWFESSERETPRRANPHMHLLESLLEYSSVTGSSTGVNLAKEIVTLFEVNFFDPSSDVLHEYFSENWSVVRTDKVATFEPGHHYEWASLLHKFSEATGHDTLSWRRRLIRRADKSGINRETGVPFNLASVEAPAANTNSRLWHSLERFRAYLLHPGLVSQAQTEQVFYGLQSAFSVNHTVGVWTDEIDMAGSRQSAAVPASILYHIVSALEPVVLRQLNS